MDILKCFVLDNTEYTVNVHWKDGQPLFRAAEIGQVLGLKKVRNSIADFDSDEKEAHTVCTPGGRQETLFLTEAGTYHLIMLSRKPIARPFQKWVTHVLVAIREQGKYELSLELAKAGDDQKAAIQHALQQQAEHYKAHEGRVLHDSLIQANHGKCVVYIGRIKSMMDGKYLIKVGSTDNIKQRAAQLTQDFGNIAFFKVVDVGLGYRMLEAYVHTHRSVAGMKFRGDVHESKRSHEVYLADEEGIRVLTNLVTANVERFRVVSAAEAAAEIEKVRLERDRVQLQLALVQQRTGEVEDAAAATSTHEVEPPEIDPTILHADARRFTHAKGDKVQRYSADGRNLLETYASAIVALRDANVDASSRLMIKQAAEKKTLYQGYRWAFLPRDRPDDEVQDIGETVADTTDIRKGFVAMLNLDRDKIMEVFADQKAASKARHLSSGASLSHAIHRETQCSGHYWRMWSDCGEALRAEYMSRSDLPDKRVKSNAQEIEKLHPVTGQVLKRYASVADVLKDHAFARASLRSACDLGYIAKGYKWRMVQPDVQASTA